MPRPERAIFRLPASALFIPILLFFIATPVASASVWTVWIYLLPVYGVFYVFWTRTIADDASITAYLPLRRRVIQWADLDGFEFHGPRWAVAVTLDGKRIRLPMVRPRDLYRLAAVSGGRLYLGPEAAEAAEAAASSDVATTTIDTAAGAAAQDPDVGSASAEPAGSTPQDAAQPAEPGGTRKLPE